MAYVRNILLRFISFGITPQMEGNKKIALIISNFDGIASCIAFLFYLIYDIHGKNILITGTNILGFILCAYGIFLIKNKFFDAGRILIHLVSLVAIFITIDGFNKNSGLQFYYFAPMIVPFATFTPNELKKSITLSISAFIVFLIQQYFGTGLFSEINQLSNSDQVLAITILFIYIVGLFTISRWQMNKAYETIKTQQAELIHISNIAALAEMSGGIAHEINNPLQILSTHISYIKRQIEGIEKVPERVIKSLEQMDETIIRISNLVKGLRNLSRNVENDALETFPISSALEDMLAVTSQKLKNLNIDLQIEGNTALKTHGHIVQLSQVFINLINNAVDAVFKLEKKWIRISITSTGNQKIVIHVTDSGTGIPKEIAQKIMRPFYTSKDPGKGTGLGLSISNSMIEKAGGRLYYEANSVNTMFVIELPKF